MNRCLRLCCGAVGESLREATCDVSILFFLMRRFCLGNGPPNLHVAALWSRPSPWSLPFEEVSSGLTGGEVLLRFFSLDLGKDLLLNSAEKQASPASTAFAPPPWAVSKGFAHPTQTQLVFLDSAVPLKTWTRKRMRPWTRRADRDTPRTNLKTIEPCIARRRAHTVYIRNFYFCPRKT